MTHQQAGLMTLSKYGREHYARINALRKARRGQHPARTINDMPIYTPPPEIKFEREVTLPSNLKKLKEMVRKVEGGRKEREKSDWSLITNPIKI